MEYLGFVIDIRQDEGAHVARISRQDRRQFLAKGPLHADYCLVAFCDTLSFRNEAEAIREAKLLAEQAKLPDPDSGGDTSQMAGTV